MVSTSENELLVRQVVQELIDRGGETVAALYVGEVCSFTDYIVICTARNETHLRGLCRRMIELLHAADQPPHHSKRCSDNSGWTPIDCGFMVIHLMTPEMRAYYELERIWFMGRMIL